MAKFLILYIAVMLPGVALSCLSTEKWQRVPSIETVTNADSVYLARLRSIDHAGPHRLRLNMMVIETFKGERSEETVVIVEKVVAVHSADKVVDYDHSSDRFWAGDLSNAVINGDCSFSPREYFGDGEYLLLLRDSKIVSAVGFERVLNRDTDAWLSFVSSHAKDE